MISLIVLAVGCQFKANVLHLSPLEHVILSGPRKTDRNHPLFHFIQVLNRTDASAAKPPSLLNKHSYYFFTKMMVHILLPVFLVAALVWNAVRTHQDWNLYGAKDLTQQLLVDPVAVTLPLVSFTFPTAWILANYLALSWVLGVYGSSRYVRFV